MTRYIAMLSWLSGRRSDAVRGSARHGEARREILAPELLEIASLDSAAVLGRLDTSSRGLGFVPLPLSLTYPTGTVGRIDVPCWSLSLSNA
jgi:hypothetical protein